jgi:biopolymer transport protein ExbB
LRFIGSDGKTPLNYQIESFDPVLGVAQIWLDVPIWPRTASKQSGCTTATQGAGDEQRSGDVRCRLRLVYHFDDQTGTPPRDATAYGNNAVSGNALRIVDGIIGKRRASTARPI